MGIPWGDLDPEASASAGQDAGHSSGAEDGDRAGGEGDADVGLMALWALLNMSGYEPAQVRASPCAGAGPLAPPPCGLASSAWQVRRWCRVYVLGEHDRVCVCVFLWGGGEQVGCW